MKILHVITAFDRGGAENHLVDLVTHQRAAGWSVTLAYLRGHGYWVEPMRKLGVTVHFLALRFYGDPRPFGKLRALLADGVEPFAQALARLTDPAVRQRFGVAGRRRVDEHFAVARMCAETDAAFARVLQRVKPTPRRAG